MENRPTKSEIGTHLRIRARIAVAVLFLVNGLTLASVVVWFPTLKIELGLSNVALGGAIAVGPLGGLVLGMTAAPLAARFGSGRVASVGASIGAGGLVVLGFASAWWSFAVSMFILGAADSITDSAMNSHGLRVQRRYGRSIINSFHALWSLGAVVGGLIGAVMVSIDVTRSLALGVTAAVLVAIVMTTGRWRLTGTEESERPIDDGVMPGSKEPGLRQAVRMAPMLLLSFGLIAAMAGAVEDSAASWAAIHMRETLGAPPFVAGLGFVAAQAMMVVGRTGGDRMVDRFSARTVVRMGSLLAFAGMVGVVLGPHPVIVIIGFAMAGLGVATHFPLGLGAAGNIPGMRSADGVAVASWLARLSFFVVPPLVGALADAAGLRWGLTLVVACAGAAFFLAQALPGRQAADPG